MDTYFGVSIADPFRWLEADIRESKDVENWVQKQNTITRNYIKQLPHYKEIVERLTTLMNYERFWTPFKAGGRLFMFQNDGLQNQNILYRMDTIDAEPVILIDPNKWSEDGTVALDGLAFSDDGKHVAYGVQESGSDWRTWYVMEIESGKKLDDQINWVKFGAPAWAGDGSGFYYSCFDEPIERDVFHALNKNHKVYYHKLGTSQSDDSLVHKDEENSEWRFYPTVSEDGNYLVISVWKGTDDRQRIMYMKLGEPNANIVTLIDNFEHEFVYLGNEESRFFFMSDFNAPNKCIVAINLETPEQENWDIMIPEVSETMIDAGMVSDYLIVQYLKDVKPQVKQFNLDGSFVREVEFRDIGSVDGFKGKRTHRSTFYSFSSFNRLPSIFHYDLQSGETSLFREVEVDFNPKDYLVKQIFYRSKDGTKVPMFICHRKDFETNGSTPTLLYGYGGFNLSVTPRFTIPILQWMEMGGVFAVPNIRGGGEYGMAWHKAGTKTNRQNGFDDFIAAAEWLIDNKYTSPQTLAIQGHSNGGLLVGACMTQRPDLYGACLPVVGVMDMLRFHKFTVGQFWIDEYGCPETSELEFKALRQYSPYHNIIDGTEYPPTMISTADTDDRVVPGHSFKFAARLQEAQAGSNPILLRINTNTGHGDGKPLSKSIEEFADYWAFLVKHLRMKPKFPAKENE